jgi:hypothetical protein
VLVVVIVVISRIVPALIIGIVHIVTESLDITDFATGPTCNVIRHVLHVLYRIIPFAIDILGNVFNVLDFFSCPAGRILREILDILNSVTDIIFNIVLGIVELVLYLTIRDESKQMWVGGLLTDFLSLMH